jgi:two-component system sensor histidine kinase/response regulator
MVSPPLAQTRPNILIVDDRRENLMATEKILRHLDASLFKATSGNEALSLMLRHRFAVILLDVQMPEMDGFETALLMQEHEAMRNTPIIFITAISKEEKYANQAAEIGAVDYIFKPINPEILKSKIKVYLDLFMQREQILKLNTTLTQSNEELERFAYICSHDLQEPVRIMKSYAEILERNYRPALDANGSRYLGFISSHARHMHQMINDILAFSRVGREEMTLEQVDCAQLARDVLAEFETIISEKAAIVACEMLPTLISNATIMRVLLQNLIGNALKFHDGSRVPHINVSAVREKTGWQFCVRDNGIGIEPQYHAQVFAIFRRIHRKEEYPGMGIGLSTCKKLVELCGGMVWFESQPHAGTAFYFTIPIAEQGKGLS